MGPDLACVAGEPDPPDPPDTGSELTLSLASRIATLLSRRIAALDERTPAELSFANLWLFRIVHRWRFHDGPWPHIAGIGYDGQHHALPLFDVRLAPVAVLRALVARHGSLSPLSEPEAAAMDGRHFTLTANRDDSDYLYRASDFRHYQGSGLHNKRNLMAALLATHPVQARAYQAGHREDALTVLAGWMLDKGLQAGEADEIPCREALGRAGQLGLRGFLYEVDGRAAGFLLAEALQPGLWVIRFAKARMRYKGLAQFMFHHFAADDEHAVIWLNFEQDLGLPNFRQTKMSYRPAALIPKWRLLPRQEPSVPPRPGIPP